MKKSAYLPRTDEGKFLWLNNFAGKLQNHAATLGISQEQITSVQNDTQMMNYMINEVNRMKNGLAERVGYKDILISGNGSEPQAPTPVYQNVAPPTVVPFGIIARISRLVRHIKSHENYNEAIGNDLGVIGSDTDESISDMKPLLNVKLHAGKPVVEWKKGHADSIDLYVNRGEGSGYVYLANDMSPHYTDDFPMPADSKMLEWRYKGIYRIKDEQVGIFSDEVGILVKKEVG